MYTKHTMLFGLTNPTVKRYFVFCIHWTHNGFSPGSGRPHSTTRGFFPIKKSQATPDFCGETGIRQMSASLKARKVLFSPLLRRRGAGGEVFIHKPKTIFYSFVIAKAHHVHKARNVIWLNQPYRKKIFCILYFLFCIHWTHNGFSPGSGRPRSTTRGFCPIKKKPGNA